MVIIPFQPFPSFKEECILDNIPYRLVFSWNSRGEFWNMIIKTREEQELLSVRLVLNYPILRQYPGRGLPPGEMMVVDTADNDDNIAYDDFTGSRSLALVYAGEDEL